MTEPERSSYDSGVRMVIFKLVKAAPVTQTGFQIKPRRLPRVLNFFSRAPSVHEHGKVRIIVKSKLFL